MLGSEVLTRLRAVEVELINESTLVIGNPHQPRSMTQSLGVLRAYLRCLFCGLPFRGLLFG